jgi:flavin prenyltransferase
VPYSIRLLQLLRAQGIPVHLVISKSAARAVKEESGLTLEDVRALATVNHSNGDLGASIASGSFKTRGMIIVPCSIRTLSDIAYGTTDTLLSRSADVVLKERRRLVLMVRETPLHHGHLRSMLAATENGAIIMPPVPAFYNRPATLEDIIDQTVGRCLDLFDIDSGLVERWQPGSEE